jgi:ABC-2 type transport system ATP-binding protein
MLTLRDVRKSFGATRAVDGLSLDVHRGEVFGFLGPNGAGKTTTINMVAGLIEPDSGTVMLDGAGSPSDPRARGARRRAAGDRALRRADGRRKSHVRREPLQ